VTFWDSSALLPLLVWEEETGQRESQLRAVSRVAVWWGTRIECHSVLRRKQREGVLDERAIRCAMERLGALSRVWIEVIPGDALRSRSERLLNLHPLRAADAMQLAAALLACEERTEKFSFHTSDTRLAAAAAAEGFTVK